MATLTVKMGNPGDEVRITVDDTALLKLFTDSASTKKSVDLLWKVVLGGFALVGGVLSALIVLVG